MEEYDSTEILSTPKGKYIGRTQLGQVVRYYARAKEWAESCAAVGSGLATHRCTDLRCADCVGTAEESGTHACTDPAPWSVRIHVKAALWQVSALSLSLSVCLVCVCVCVCVCV